MVGSFSAEAQQVWDFTRCQRADGTYYGTGGKCRKGSEVSAKQKEALAKASPEQLKKLAKSSKLSAVQKKAVKEEITKKAGGGGDSKEEYASLMKQQQEMVSKGDMKGAMELGPKLKALTDKLKADEANDPAAQAQKAAMMKRLDDEGRERTAFKARQAGYDKAQEDAASKLTSSDKKAIADYTHMSGAGGMRSYKNLNKCLRLPDGCPDKAEAAKFEKQFKAALKKLPKNTSGDPFYRGVTSAALYQQLENAQPGTVMKDPGYGSYSSDRRQTRAFMLSGAKDANVLFVSRNKGLTPINKFSKIESEAEAIMPSNQQQTIRSVRKDGETLIVELD